MDSIKQSQTVPLLVGYQYLPTQSVISTLKKVKMRGIKTTIDQQTIGDTETDILLPFIRDNNEF
jgi:hypothetical protein